MRYAVLALLVATPSAAHTPATVLRVKDGDTLIVRGELWPGLTQEATIRLAGINAAEIHSARPCEVRDANAARSRVIELTRQGVRLEQVEQGLYKRWSAVVLLPDGTNLNQLLVNEGLAVNYDGQTKRPEWACKKESER